jgi:hypothetical protein
MNTNLTTIEVASEAWAGQGRTGDNDKYEKIIMDATQPVGNRQTLHQQLQPHCTMCADGAMI